MATINTQCPKKQMTEWQAATAANAMRMNDSLEKEMSPTKMGFSPISVGAFLT